MKCNQSGPGFELVSSCPYPATITITPRAPLHTPRAPPVVIFWVSNKTFYRHLLERVNNRIATTIVLVRPCCYLFVRKVDEHRKFCPCSFYTKVYQLLQFVSSHREEERMKAEPSVFARLRRTLHHEEKEWADTNFLSVFSFCFNVFVRWFSLQATESGSLPIFELSPKYKIIVFQNTLSQKYFSETTTQRM